MTDYQPLNLGVSGFEVFYCPETGSTNDDLLERSLAGARDGLVLVAGTQTRGRGRQGRSWQSKPGCSLAFSIHSRPAQAESACLARFSALGALALVEVIEEQTGKKAELKWPNDVLVDRKKVSGVLVEVNWQANQPVSVVLGMGVNLLPGAVPVSRDLLYPASDLETTAGWNIGAQELLTLLLIAIKRLRPRLPQPDFIQLWNSRLAFRDEIAPLRDPEGRLSRVRVVRVNEDGSLSVIDESGIPRLYYSAEVSS